MIFFFFGFCQHNIAFIVVVDFNNFAIAFFKLYKNLGQKKTRENESIFSDLFDFGAASVVVVIVHFTHALYCKK